MPLQKALLLSKQKQQVTCLWPRATCLMSFAPVTPLQEPSPTRGNPVKSPLRLQRPCSGQLQFVAGNSLHTQPRNSTSSCPPAKTPMPLHSEDPKGRRQSKKGKRESDFTEASPRTQQAIPAQSSGEAPEERYCRATGTGVRISPPQPPRLPLLPL